MLILILFIKFFQRLFLIRIQRNADINICLSLSKVPVTLVRF